MFRGGKCDNLCLDCPCLRCSCADYENSKDFKIGEKFIPKDDNALQKTIEDNKSRDLAMYILVNSDIKINIGKLAGQVGHAVAVYMFQNKEPELIKEYMENMQKKIILYDTQKNLEKYEQMGFIAIRDKGFTDLEPNTLTCVNLGIMDKDQRPEEIKSLKLCR